MDYYNFNNAGSSKTFKKSNNSIIKYLQMEEKYGGYYCTERFDYKIKKFYKNLSKLINCEESEISFIPNTTYGYNLFINSLGNLKIGNVIIFSNEYESNIICLRNKNINYRVVQIKDNGDFNLDDLKRKIDKKTTIISLPHITSYNGNESPAEKIGKIIKTINPRIFYLVDACQSIGHLNVDIKKIKCDILIGSGRKFLRGPRGTGFIYVNKKCLNFIKPLIMDSHNSELSKCLRIKKKNIFENFEHSPALKIGLSESIESINKIGIKKIERNIKEKSLYFREKLQKKKNLIFLEDKNKITGLNTLSISNISSKKIYTYLLKKKILTSVVQIRDFTRILKKNKNSSALRVSFHYYNTYKQIDYLIKCISRI